MPSFYGANIPRSKAAVEAIFGRRDAEDDFGASGSLPPRIPSSARGHASGLPASCGTASFCFGYTENALFGLGSRAHSLGFVQCDPSRIREIQRNGDYHHVPEQSQPYRFLGKDRDVRTNDNRSFATLSLATNSAYKKDGKYIEHTEWHRCVVFGKFGGFAGHA
jgi:single-strand DNA-binding protein